MYQNGIGCTDVIFNVLAMGKATIVRVGVRNHGVTLSGIHQNERYKICPLSYLEWLEIGYGSPC